MLTVIHLHTPVAPHDVWSSWNLDPFVVAGLVVAAWAYVRGYRAISSRGRDGRMTAFGVGLAAVLVALASPLDAMAASLASAHMAQHMVLIVVAGPLLAWSRPLSTMLRGTPLGVRKATGGWRRRRGLTPHRLARVPYPGLVWLTHAGLVWVWHSSVLYGAALGNQALHALEHASFLVPAVLFWSVVFEGFWAPDRSKGFGILLLFTMAMQGVVLAALMTFAVSPWYAEYARSAPWWGLEPLGDQQLAGLIMWIPSGLIYTGAALVLLASWIGDTESPATGAAGARVRS